MGFFKSLFGKTKPVATARRLERPEQLQINDMVEFSGSFALPAQLRGQTLRVGDVHTCEFEHRHFPVFLLQGSGDGKFGLAIDPDSADQLRLSLLLNREQVGALFDLDAFATIFEPGHSELIRQAEPEPLSGWLAERYHEFDDALPGYYHRRDHRGLSRPQGDNGQPFQYYSLYSDDQSQAVEIDVFSSGATHVYLTLLRPRTDIQALWPAN